MDTGQLSHEHELFLVFITISCPDDLKPNTSIKTFPPQSKQKVTGEVENGKCATSERKKRALWPQIAASRPQCESTSSWFSNQTIVNQKEIKDLKRTHGPIPRSSEGLWQTLPRVPKFRGCVIADRVSNEQLWVCNLKKRQSMNWMSTCHNRKWIIWVCLSRSSLWTARFPI